MNINRNIVCFSQRCQAKYKTTYTCHNLIFKDLNVIVITIHSVAYLDLLCKLNNPAMRTKGLSKQGQNYASFYTIVLSRMAHRVQRCRNTDRQAKMGFLLKPGKQHTKKKQ